MLNIKVKVEAVVREVTFLFYHENNVLLINCSFFILKCITLVETRWIFKLICSLSPYRSCWNLNNPFTSMFPNSDVAISFKLSKAKCAYIVV